MLRNISKLKILLSTIAIILLINSFGYACDNLLRIPMCVENGRTDAVADEIETDRLKRSCGRLIDILTEARFAKYPSDDKYVIFVEIMKYLKAMKEELDEVIRVRKRYGSGRYDFEYKLQLTSGQEITFISTNVRFREPFDWQGAGVSDEEIGRVVSIGTLREYLEYLQELLKEHRPSRTTILRVAQKVPYGLIKRFIDNESKRGIDQEILHQILLINMLEGVGSIASCSGHRRSGNSPYFMICVDRSESQAQRFFEDLRAFKSRYIRQERVVIKIDYYDEDWDKCSDVLPLVVLIRWRLEKKKESCDFFDGIAKIVSKIVKIDGSNGKRMLFVLQEKEIRTDQQINQNL